MSCGNKIVSNCFNELVNNRLLQYKSKQQNKLRLDRPGNKVWQDQEISTTQQRIKI